MRAHIVYASTPAARAAFEELSGLYGHHHLDDADVILAVGGDGFMLDTLRQGYGLPVYGINRGTVGFLMNDVPLNEVHERVGLAHHQDMPLLEVSLDGKALATAINDVALLRASPQAANLRVSVNGEERLDRLACDGILVSTAAGSTAYNASLGGPILPIDANVLALTPMAPFRPRRWKGAVLPSRARIEVDVLDAFKRPVGVSADGQDLGQAERIVVSMAQKQYTVLFDPGHSLERRILDEQFT